jgi:hypothetical protein
MADSAAPWALLCNHGGVHLDSASAPVFLKANPHGAYTTTRTGNEGASLLLWKRHLRRLSQSMEILAAAMQLQRITKPSQTISPGQRIPPHYSQKPLNILPTPHFAVEESQLISTRG